MNNRQPTANSEGRPNRQAGHGQAPLSTSRSSRFTAHSSQFTEIELLSPARDLACGLAAVDHGADAVYIGAPRFGARAAASNTVDDIARLTDYAHRFGVRVYVALNTLLTNDQLPEAERLAWELWRAGADALIVQDMGLLRCDLPPLPLHASTQTDNRTAEKVDFLAKAGFGQVVLARELSLADIRRIHTACPATRLEVFVHGALCVSYSGRCYASQHCFGRSANRGECAQFCRLPFDLTDQSGRVLASHKHLLSLRDMNRLDRLEELIDAGASSLKIEGRLKGVDYVKNVTAAYSQRLDEIVRRRPDLRRASSGNCTYRFQPDVNKTFNRGFTTYFLDGGRPTNIAAIDTPKAVGERVAIVRRQPDSRTLLVNALTTLHNGDGLCYTDPQGQLRGFRINRVEDNRLLTAEPLPPIAPHTVLNRNHDQALRQALLRPSAERRIAISWLLTETAFGFALTATDEDELHATRTFACTKQPAEKPQAEVLRAQLMRLGNTLFTTTPKAVDIRLSANWFLPISLLANERRTVVERLTMLRRLAHRVPMTRPTTDTTHPLPDSEPTDYNLNVMNDLAREFYALHNVPDPAPAYELKAPSHAVLMTCRHCIRHTLGLCPKRQLHDNQPAQPLYLKSEDGRHFRLDFDCKKCEMTVKAASGPA